MFVIISPAHVKSIDVNEAITLSKVKAIAESEFQYRLIFENELEAAKVDGVLRQVIPVTREDCEIKISRVNMLAIMP